MTDAKVELVLALAVGLAAAWLVIVEPLKSDLREARMERDAARVELWACDSVRYIERLSGGPAPRWYPMADRSGAVLVERDSVRQVSRWRGR